jgi:hypothetical protein
MGKLHRGDLQFPFGRARRHYSAAPDLKEVEELKRRKRGAENEARTVAMYLGRQLGGHKYEEIGRAVGLQKTSSVRSAYLLMKERVAKEKRLARMVRKIEEALVRSKKQT